MVYAEGQLSGSADFRVGMNIWYISSNQAGNFSTFGWEVQLNTPQQYGTFDDNQVQYWSTTSGFSGTFILSYDQRYNNNRIIASGTQNVYHDSNGYRPGFATSASITTGHNSVGSGTSAPAWIDAPRIPKPPAAPTPIGLDQPTESSLRYRFNGNDNGGANILEWQINYSHRSDFAGSAYTPSSGTTTLYGLGSGALYYARARGRNVAGWGPWSSVSTAWTWDIPDAPGRPTISEVSATSLKASFGAVPTPNNTPVTAYSTQLSTSSTFASILQTKTGSSPVVFTGLTNHTTYYVRTRAQNAVGWGPYSAVATDATLGHPSAPRSILATASTTNTGRITVTWTAPATPGEGGIVGYTIYRNGAQVATTTGTGGTWTDTGRTPYTSYSYNVAARNKYSSSVGGTGPQGTANSEVAPGPPSAPRSLTATNITATAGRVVLSWTAPVNVGAGGITGYNIDLTNGTSIAVTTGTETTYTVNGLTPNVSYSFRVSARNKLADTEKSESAFSNTATITPEGEAGAPSGLTVTQAPTTSNRLVLSWSAASGDVVGYNIFRRVGSTDTLIGTINANHTAFSVDDLTSGQSYSFVVRARSTYTDSLPTNGYPGSWGGPASSVASATATVNSTQTVTNSSSASNGDAQIYNGTFTISSVESNKIKYTINHEGTLPETFASGIIPNLSNPVFNGSYTIQTPTSTSITYSKTSPDVEPYNSSGTVSNSTNADLNGTFTVTDVNAGAFLLSYAKSGADFAVRTVPYNAPPGASSKLTNMSNTVFNGTGLVITEITENTFSYAKTGGNFPEVDAAGTVTNVTNRDTFNGDYTITSVPTYNTFTYTRAKANVSPRREWYVASDGVVRRTVSPSSVTIKFRSGWAG